MYRIGEFSNMFQITIKTLRYYDEIDLFKPSFKDPYTGYRYYDDKQIKEFEKIMKLKDLNFSLDDIKVMKDEMDSEKLDLKIKELESEQKSLKLKISHLEDMKLKGENKMKYKIGIDSNVKLNVIGKRIIVKNKNKEALDKYFIEIEKSLDKLKIKYHSRVIITEEVGYKEEDVELFIGYIERLNTKLIDKINKKKKLGLEIYSNPTSDYLVSYNVDDEYVKDACSDLIKYAGVNELQILGPFIEIKNWLNGKDTIYVMIHDLKRNNIHDELIKERALKKYNEEFTNNEKIIGNWKIKEILPNISFNPNIKKSDPDTYFNELQFLENGKTNYDNVTWNNNYLFIKSDNGLTCNYMDIINIDNKEYLEIRMSDMSTIYNNAKPISYIYER